jgi:hypothetical protein
MLEWFKIGFAIGLGLTTAMLAILMAAGLFAGLAELVEQKIKLAQWRRQIKT